ncbi:hypothetical protein V1478_016926, partial [Vespula squamosa]
NVCCAIKDTCSFFIPKIARSQDSSIDDEQTTFILDICKLYGSKSTIFLYPEFLIYLFIFLRNGDNDDNFQMETFTILRRCCDIINEFFLATSTFDMSFAVWLVIFIYEENGTDYYHRLYKIYRLSTRNVGSLKYILRLENIL